MHYPLQYLPIEFILYFKNIFASIAYVGGTNVLDDFLISLLHLCLSRMHVRYFVSIVIRFLLLVKVEDIYMF